MEFHEWISIDRRNALKIAELIEDILSDPFIGKGKPEPLKHDKKGLWSRRITLEHRLVYKVEENEIIIIACKYHY